MPVTLGASPDHGFDQPLGLLSDCHRRIERFLNALWRVTSDRHGGELQDEERHTLRRALEYFRNAAPRHTEDEEASLFPRLRAIDSPQVKALMRDVERLEADHRAAEAQHDRVHELVDGWLGRGQLGERHLQELVVLLAALRDMYREHIAQEDERVFPLAARLLSQSQLEQIGQEMAMRRGVETRRLDEESR
ncbi:MAG: hemerythrin domain-containing protein [Phycisphaerales bacterium]|nr:hemerythrin domain-containing protein [Phycisphaerales bacterium]